MTPEQLEEMRRAATEARRARAERKRDAIESSRMGLQALIGRETEREAERLVARALRLALSEDDNVATRGLQLLWDRHLGKAVQPTEDRTPELPADLQAIRDMTPEERRALLRSLS